MAKIRPKAGPTAAPGAGSADAAKAPNKKKVKTRGAPSAPGQSTDPAKTAADLSKAKKSRTGKLLEGKPGAARAAAAKKKAAGANLPGLMQRVRRRAAGLATRFLVRLEARTQRVHTIIQRHHELGYVVRYGGKDEEHREEEIKKAALRLQELGAGSGNGTPALARLMERASGLDGNSGAADWAARFRGAGELIEESGRELHDVNTKLASAMKTAEKELTRDEVTRSDVLNKFRESANAILDEV
ncbi:MAG: hypothetical protein HKN20_00425 [Gemmatimonadetes bacterium]|nr:hypothetical protein [Gemmatimonadota bacterium]